MVIGPGRGTLYELRDGSLVRNELSVMFSGSRREARWILLEISVSQQLTVTYRVGFGDATYGEWCGSLRGALRVLYASYRRRARDKRVNVAERILARADLSKFLIPLAGQVVPLPSPHRRGRKLRGR